MKKLLYHKLVRDRIPEIIEESGKSYSVRQVREEELTRYALKKLREEVQEFVENPCAEEAADVREIFEFICEREGIKESVIRSQQISKRVTKGSFGMGFVLGWVEDE